MFFTINLSSPPPPLYLYFLFHIFVGVVNSCNIHKSKCCMHISFPKRKFSSTFVETLSLKRPYQFIQKLLITKTKDKWMKTYLVLMELGHPSAVELVVGGVFAASLGLNMENINITDYKHHYHNKWLLCKCSMYYCFQEGSYFHKNNLH